MLFGDQMDFAVCLGAFQQDNPSFRILLFLFRVYTGNKDSGSLGLIDSTMICSSCMICSSWRLHVFRFQRTPPQLRVRKFAFFAFLRSQWRITCNLLSSLQPRTQIRLDSVCVRNPEFAFAKARTQIRSGFLCVRKAGFCVCP